MNKIMTFIAAVGLFLTLAVVSVSAQTARVVQVNIPFDFSADKANLKAGTYTITRGSGSALRIRSADGKKTMLVNAPLTIGSRESKAGERLVFNRYGNEYYLTEVWLTVDSGRQLLPSKAETKAAQELGRQKTISRQRVEVAVTTR